MNQTVPRHLIVKRTDQEVRHGLRLARWYRRLLKKIDKAEAADEVVRSAVKRIGREKLVKHCIMAYEAARFIILDPKKFDKSDDEWVLLVTMRMIVTGLESKKLI